MEERPCTFCARDEGRLISSDALTVTIRDAFPVAPGHTLLIPRRHVSSWFDLADGERRALFRAADAARARLDAELRPDGYNLGINVGGAAGQTVWHVHVHLIPRYWGDVEEPRGGVRHTIPGRGSY
jgi:diadenosine tetraphosphate (Ap4A) HIT family hydrolase